MAPFLFLLGLVMVRGQISEYCNGDVFEPMCDSDHVIVVDEALYGRMRIGRCVKKSLGHLGCSNNALAFMDSICSGLNSCQVTISNRLQTEAACEMELAGYAEITYSCHQVIKLRAEHCIGNELQLTSPEVALVSKLIHETCISNTKLRLSVAPGQTMNITLWEFDSQADVSHGTIRDELSTSVVEILAQGRVTNIMETVGHIIEIDFHRQPSADVNYLINIQTLGCADMTPPDGAWITRDGNDMEIGCHSGSKSWSLHCEENNWTGVLGQCGTLQDDISARELKESGTKVSSVSLNAFLFGLCSSIIFLSACVFLAAVFILKRKLSAVKKENTPAGQTLPLMGTLQMHTLPRTHSEHANTLPRIYRDQSNTVWVQSNTLPIYHNPTDAGEYKTLQMLYTTTNGAQAPPVTRSKVRTKSTSSDYSQYINSTQSEKSESVKYFVLEDVAREPLTVHQV